MCGGKVGIPPIVKEKRRNSDKRREKSRDAARCRRSRESEIFSDLSSQLPLSQSVISTLDKASIMRLSVDFLKVREVMKVLESKGKDITKSVVDSLYETVLNGFLLVLSEEGDIIYLSENVEEFIGIPQAEMMGHSVYEFSHPYDHEEIKTFLSSSTSSKSNETSEEETISFFVRMKSTLKSKARTVNLKSSTYQVIHYIGHKINNPVKPDDSKCPTFYLIFIGRTIPHPVQIDIPLDKEIFISRHSPDMKFTHIDERITEFLGFQSSELMGKSVYTYHHALDAAALASSFQTLFSKGQCETGYYRFLAKNGGYIWVVTQATLIYDNGSKPECVVCLNYVLSKVENQHEIVSAEQKPIEKPDSVVEDVERPKLVKPPVQLSSTSAIFAPKETVMSKSFLNFPDADILLFQEPLKDSKLNLDLDLFPDDPCAIGSNICDDPFISYRDDSLSSPSYCGTPESSLNLHSSSSTSPNHFSTTPSTPESGSLSDIPSLDPIDEFSNLDLKFTMPPSASDKDSDCYEEDLDFRAPFISMNMDDDFPLISPSSSVMWGPQEPAPKKTTSERLPDSESQRISLPRQKYLTETNMKSSLAALLQSDLKKSPQNKEKNVISRKDNLNKRWQNSSVDNNKNNLKKNLSSRNYGNGGSGHIIMLDSLPIKKQTGKSNSSQKRNSHPASSDRRTNSPPYGSHTATVKVNDRLIKVQVSVSELTSSSINQKQPFPSPPDPPPKRTSPSRFGPTESPKRLKVDNGTLCSSVSAPQGIASDSVLLNLLISGEDASRGYLCSGNSRYSENKSEPAVLSLPAFDSKDSSNCTELLASESELLDSFLKISQYDAEVNAPIQSSHLLQGDDLLSALDHQPLLRNVPTLV